MDVLSSADIKAMIAEGENVNVEFKECGKTFPKDFWPTYSAFANTHGGWVILGIKENIEKQLPERFEITGIGNIAKILNELDTTLNNQQKVSRNLLTSNDIYIVNVDGADVIVIYVPEADYRQKPVFLHQNKVAHSYKRTFEGDMHLTDEELNMMLRDAFSGDNDLSIMDYLDMRHIDVDTLRKYRTVFNIRNVGHVYTDLSDKDFLIQLGGYMIDEAKGKEGLTMAGLLMFGKGLYVRNFFPNLRMDYLDLSNVEEGSPVKWNERLTYDGSWENNLYNFITFVMGKITFGLPNPGVLKGIIRDDDSSLKQSLREGVTNAVIHSDYRIEGCLRIEKRSDSIELRNPGLLKLSREKIYNGKHTRARNPKIQDMLRMIGLGDNIGSGFPLILKTWKEEAWTQPELVEDRELHEVTLKLRMTSIYAPEVIDFLHSLYGNDFDNLTSEEKEIIVMIASDKCKTNSDLQQSLQKNGWALNKILTQLTNKKILNSNPNGRWTTYTLNTAYTRQHNPQPKDSSKTSLSVNISDSMPHTPPDNSTLNQHLTSLQKSIIQEMTDNPGLTGAEIAERLGISYASFRYNREKMKSIVTTKHVGANQNGYWVVEYNMPTAH